MATEQKISGLKSIWFSCAMQHILSIVIDNECTIRVFEFPYFLAIKCEAYLDRGISDPWLSKDLEDIVYLLINRKEFNQEIANSPLEVKSYIVSFFRELSNKDYFNELMDGMVRSSETLAMIEKVKENWVKISRMF